jgi:hypothetical protein
VNIKLIFFLIILSAGQLFPQDKAIGIFVAAGVGPRLPIADFAGRTDLGYGFNLELSYTDNIFLPFFLFGRAGYEQYPGSQTFYQATEYANYSSTIIPLHAGARYYFAPLVENIVLFMPIVEIGISFAYLNILHEFKPGSGRTNYTEENTNLGFNVSAGVSMFLLEILATYNYFESNQYIGVDLKARLPLYINF